MAHEMTVGRLALATGVKASTVRYYERLGLLPRAMRNASGYRVFAPQAVRRLTVVRAAQQFGFPLREIAAFLRVRDNRRQALRERPRRGSADAHQTG